MSNTLKLLENLEAQVSRFKAWADTYPVAKRSGDWECDYEGWSFVYKAFTPFAAATKCEEWSLPTARMLLYILARDNEIGKLGYEIRQHPDTLICLAQRALELSDTDAEAKWQLVNELGRRGLLSENIAVLLLKFAHDTDEYVRRRTLVVLADLASPFAAELLEPAWDSGHEG